MTAPILLCRSSRVPHQTLGPRDETVACQTAIGGTYKDLVDCPAEITGGRTQFSTMSNKPENETVRTQYEQTLQVLFYDVCRFV
jgi:hypothetical protein